MNLMFFSSAQPSCRHLGQLDGPSFAVDLAGSVASTMPPGKVQAVRMELTKSSAMLHVSDWSAKQQAKSSRGLPCTWPCTQHRLETYKVRAPEVGKNYQARCVTVEARSGVAFSRLAVNRS